MSQRMLLKESKESIGLSAFFILLTQSMQTAIVCPQYTEMVCGLESNLPCTLGKQNSVLTDELLAPHKYT